METLLHVVVALVPVPLTYLIFLRTHLQHLRYLDHLEAFLWGAMLAGVVLPLALSLARHIQGDSPLVVGFLKAALIEKIAAFGLIYYLIRRKGEQVVVSEAIMSAMVVGLGFGAVENIMYAVSERLAIVIPRSLSSVPLHVSTCGLVGYFLAVARCRSVPYRKGVDTFFAFALPYVLHGTFDTLLYTGNRSVYLVGPVLVLLIFMLDYALARSQTLPPLELLEAMSLRYEEWETIQREPQFERWILRSMGTRNTEYVPLLRWHMSVTQTILVVTLVLGAALFLPLREAIMRFMELGLKPVEQVTLFSVLPAAYGAALVAVGAVNPQYFRSSLIRIPIIGDVSFRSENGDTGTAITYDISASDCLLKTVDDFPPGTVLELSFAISDFSSPARKGVVIWDNHADPAHPTGTVVRFDRAPAGFNSFLLRYYAFRFFRGVIFNLRVPGFELIRRLFVRPSSVMQQQRRFSAGEVLFREGDRGREFYLVQKGEVEFLKSVGDGETVSMAVLGPGDIFGEMAVVGAQPRAATAVCKTDCTLAVADGDNLDALIQNNPDFAGQLIRVLCQRMNSSEGILTKSIAALEETLLSRDRFYRLGVAACLAATGSPVESGVLHPRTDIARAAAVLGVSDDQARRIIRWTTDPDGRTPEDSTLRRREPPAIRFWVGPHDQEP